MFVGRGRFTVVKLTGPHKRHCNYCKHYCYNFLQTHTRSLDVLVKITIEKIFLINICIKNVLIFIKLSDRYVIVEN
jgi:hypothetical protein